MERYLAIIALRILILRSSAENGAAYRGVPLMRMVLQTIFVAVLGLVLLSCAGDPQPVGEQQIAQQTPPCEGDERFREFGKWVQVWVAAAGYSIRIEGGLEAGAMHLVGQIVGLDGSGGPFRGTWTPLADGRVRQFFEQSSDGETWAPWFDVYYERKERDRIVG
jgi:hypothetical protein